MTNRLISILLFFSILSTVASADEVSYGDRIETLPGRLAELLAQRNKPDPSGAIGRNRKGYFHVRFQMGLHHLADFAIVDRNPAAVNYFVSAMEYSFDHQVANGGFKLLVPPELTDLGKPGNGDRASGVAFFASSAGAGWLALETSGWCQSDPSARQQFERLEKLRPGLRSTLDYLISERETLIEADRHAPNRLLFNAIAFHTLGELLNDGAARGIARDFVSRAVAQVHDDGYFIEGGGHDTSYNGVATALALRLVMIGYSEELEPICRGAIDWQTTRIEPTGEVSTEGNTRVSDEGGESFLGRRKDVDVGHLIEALMLASALFESDRYSEIAERVRKFYSTQETVEKL